LPYCSKITLEKPEHAPGKFVDASQISLGSVEIR
jgi:hypothetical protein